MVVADQIDGCHRGRIGGLEDLDLGAGRKAVAHAGLDPVEPLSDHLGHHVVEGINEIVHTLLEAVALVLLVVFVFLQNWRATLIPLLTVPVSLIGAFIFFPALVPYHPTIAGEPIVPVSGSSSRTPCSSG